MFIPEHRPTGEVCLTCGLHASRHRVRPPRPRRRDTRSRRPVDRIIGIDGEGIGRSPHLYTYLAASDEGGACWDIAAPSGKGLSSIECFDLILSLPSRALVVGFAFLYDLTMMIRDLPDRAIYLLMHEKLRARLIDGRILYLPIKWNGYRINYMNRRFTISIDGQKNSSRTVWDIFAFFQSSFVNSLQTWQIADATKLERMSAMKSQRSLFNQLSTEAIHDYCKEETRYLATLARQLITAHEDADLTLKTYFGAGSTASVLLKRYGIHETRGEIPSAMREPVACAFFGGRFENSYSGPFREPVYDHDISSAYPYQAFRLPCLLCGHWRHVNQPRRGAMRGTLSLVHWCSDYMPPTSSWGPLPVRTSVGTIVFPLGGRGGWSWAEEFDAALAFSPSLRATEAWIYETDCNHRPFADIANIYRERYRVGKDAKGIVLKLGMNSVYGKLAQSKGFNAPFQSWVWAGVITSNTRAQLLRAISNASAQSSVLMLATDGVWASERIKLDVPDNTGTFDLPKPLGGWEVKEFPKGVFCVKPGIYFPIDPTDEDLAQIRARGLGRKALYANWQRIIEAWEQGKTGITIGGIQRFIGAKSGIIQSEQGARRRECYGDWVDHKVEVSFAPTPKRQSRNSDGSLKPWTYLDFESVPYDAATVSPEALLLKLAEQIAEEQPDYAEFIDDETAK